MMRNYADLKQECNDLGLTWEPTKRKAKRPLIIALRNHYINQNNVEITPGLEFRLGMESPMLAKLITGLRKDEINNIYESKNWVFDTKHNGIRMIVSSHPYPHGFEVFSRNESVSDYLPVNYSSKIYWGKDVVFPKQQFILDTEIVSTDPNISTVMGKRGVVTETELQAVAALMALNDVDSLRIQYEHNPIKFMAFDCLMYYGEDIRDKPFVERRAILRNVVQTLQANSFPFELSRCVQKSKEEFLEWIWENKGEGVIAKRLDGRYISTPSRPRNGWIKIKRTTTGVLGDSIDGFVTGFELGKDGRGFENLVGSLHVSVNLIGENGESSIHHIARVINIPLVDRKKITVPGRDGKPELDPSVYNRVVEVEGQAISARAKRLTHPRLLRWRDDKSPHDCMMKESDLNSMIV